MKHEIVYTDDYALIVSDEQIEDVRPLIGRYHLEQGHMILQFPTYLTDLTECKLIIAHRPLTDAPILEGLDMLPDLVKKMMLWNWLRGHIHLVIPKEML